MCTCKASSPSVLLTCMYCVLITASCIPSRLSFVASLNGHEGPVTAMATSPTTGDIVTACPNCKQVSVDIYTDGITCYLY